MNALLAAALMSAGPASGATPVMFGGERARTADRYDFALAKELEGRGAERGDILGQTGLFRGVDGKMKFEIDDSASHWKGGYPGPGATVGQFFHHPKLYEAYPDVAKVPLETETSHRLRGKVRGGEAVRINPREITGARAREIMLHELQHVLQGKEGFAVGGSVTDPNYRRLAGEREANMVEMRRDMPMQKRLEYPPWDDAARLVPDGKVVVRK